MTVRVPADLMLRDPAVIAPQAGLRYLPDDQPGITRRRRGGGFSYVGASGATVKARERTRIEALAIPPAWGSVWISPARSGYLQASGVDDAGRKQYRYHDDFRAHCDARKFARLAYFRRAIVQVRVATEDALGQPLGTRAHAVAAAVRLIDTCMLRVGNDQSATNGHYGATTLTVDHIVDDGFLALDYIGKSGKTHSVVVEDDDLSDILIELAHDADDELFWFDDPETGERRRASASDINRFIVQHAGAAFSAKDFRTWGGSAVALQGRAEGERLLDAVDHAAAELGNTRAVARSSYIHPAVLDADDDEVGAVWRSSRSSRWLSRAESALGKLIGT